MINKPQKVFRPIDENEMKDWKPAPKSDTAKQFEAFLNSTDNMVEVNLDYFPFSAHGESARIKSTKQDRFASAFYAWKKNRKKYFQSMGIEDILLVRRDKRIALKKVRRKE